MKKQILYFILGMVCIKSFAQIKQTIHNETEFKSVFKKIKTGTFDGTGNGVLFLKNAEGQDMILDFQGSAANLILENDPDEVYDVSFKNYKATTTSGKSKITYKTYAYANELTLSLGSDTYQVGLLDGAMDEIIKGLKYFYKAEKGAEYLVLEVEKELILTNYYSLLKSIDYDEKKVSNIKDKEKSIKVLPNSTIVFAIKR